MKKIFGLLVATVFLAGCATPHEKAEKLAQKIEKESLTAEAPAAKPVPADPQPEHLFSFTAKVAMTPVVLGAQAVRDFARALPDLVFAPVHIAKLPIQIIGDTLAFFGEIGKALFPPPPPQVK